MDFSSILPKKKEKRKEYFWAVTLEWGWVQAGVWTITEGKVELTSVSPPSAWQTDEELINSSDTVLSAAVSELPEEAGEPVKTVFGVPSSWVKDGNIVDEYLVKIKNICTRLSLEPVGFVVIPEAISHFIKSADGSPLSAIVVGFGQEVIEMSLFRIGVLVGSVSVARSISVVDDIVEGLSRFSGMETLPSRVILYDGKEGELDEIRQSVMAANWNQYPNLRFLHTPKIEIFAPKDKVTATALAGGLEIAQTTGLILPGKDKDIGEERVETTEMEPLDYDENVQQVSPQEVGFIVGQDIATVESKKDDLPPKMELDNKHEPPSQYPVSDYRKNEGNESVYNTTPAKDDSKPVKEGVFPRIKSKLALLVSRLKRPKKDSLEKNSQKSNAKRIMRVGIVVFVLFIVGLFLYWWFLPKATVTIYVSPKTLEEQFTIYVDPNATEANFETSTIPGDLVKSTVSGEKTISTTGTKTVGEKAKGEVEFYRSGSEITLSAGTVVTGSSDLKFTLDSDVTIASGSASTPGKAKGNVTAYDIGAQYNLAKGEVFTVANYLKSDIEAKNENAFSGGSSREINAVSQEDIDKLEEDLSKELTDQGTVKIEESLSQDQTLIEESIEVDPLEKTFSNKVGDEATSLSLKMTLEVQALVLVRTSLLDFSEGILKDEIPSSYVLRKDQIESDFEVIGEEEGVYEVVVTVKANLLPDVNPEEIAQEISGKYPTLAEEYLTEIDGFTKAEITLKPKLPGRLGTLPRIEKNITIEVTAAN